MPLSGDTIIDISHESLIRQWSRLSEWLVNEARGAAVVRRIAESKSRYDSGEGDLLSGLDLANIGSWWEEDNPSPDWVARYAEDFDGVESYLHLSQETDTKRQEERSARFRRERRRLQWFAGTTSCIALVAAFFFFDAQNKRNEADELRQTAEISEGQMLDATESLAIDLVERLEGDRTIPVQAKYGLIQNTENAFRTIAASRTDDPVFIEQRANFLLASVVALSQGGFWAEAEDYAERLETLLSENSGAWTRDLDFDLRSAVALAEHHRKAARHEQAGGAVGQRREALDQFVDVLAFAGDIAGLERLILAGTHNCKRDNK